MGGAIVAAPATLPLLYLGVRRHPTPAYRRAGAVLAGLTAAEAAWAAVYVAAGEPKPAIWLVPLATGMAVAVLFGVTQRSTTCD